MQAYNFSIIKRVKMNKTAILIIIIFISSFIICCRNKNVDNVSTKLKEHNGWFQGIIGNEIYNTIGNATQKTVTDEQNNGWQFIGYYSADTFDKLEKWQDTNFAIFRKDIMNFMMESNPWKNKASMQWLPDLDYILKNEDNLQLTESLGHDCPAIKRKMICHDCKSDEFIIDISENEISGICTKCNNIESIWNNTDMPIDLLPDIQKLKNKSAKIIYSIEYPVDAIDGTDFSWILISGIINSKRYDIADGEI